jgi:hypothetical protein
MRSRLIAVPIAALVLAGAVMAVVASPVSAEDDDQPHSIAVGRVRLSGDQEVPAADPDGFGRFTYIAAGDKLCYILSAFNVDPPVAAHIHVGAAGVNGPIVVALELPDPVSAACITAEPDSSLNSAMVLTQEELDAIIANEAGYYANVHTAPFPAGAIRGQLR